MTFCATDISYSIQRRVILNRCSLVITPGKFTAIVGPNGAGKSTLLKILANEHTNYSGTIELNGKNATKFKNRTLSQIRSVLPQHTAVNFPFSIEQVIDIGRYPHLTTKSENEKVISEVIELTNLTNFRGRIYQTLSGGEQQRVQMARVMAQLWDETDFPKYLLLDEPTSNLDLAQQYNLLDLAKSLCKRNIGVLAILHDLNLAAQYADEITFLKGGCTIAQGLMRDVMTTDIIEKTFNHPVKVMYDELTGHPMIYAISKKLQNRNINTTINNHVYEQFTN